MEEKEEILIDSEKMEKLVPPTSSKDWSFQNRDVLKWMNRIEIGKTYKEDASILLKKIGRVISEVSKQVLIQQWSNEIADHDTPSNISVDADIKSPIIKKLHSSGDKEDYFIYYKEYPFYYVWNISDLFSLTVPNSMKKISEDECRNWYVSNLSVKIQNEVLRLVKREIDKKYVDIFNFPKSKDEFKENKINIVFSSSMKYNSPSSKPTQYSLFKNSSDYADMIIHELSIAMGRILNPSETNVKECTDVN